MMTENIENNKYTILIEGTGSIENITEQIESFSVQMSNSGHQIGHTSVTRPNIEDKYTILIEGTGSIENITEQIESFLVQIFKVGHQINHATITQPNRTQLGKPKLTSIGISPSISIINVGKIQQLTAACKDQYGNIMTCPALVWHTDNAGIATVDATGKVTGREKGIAHITATYG